MDFFDFVAVLVFGLVPASCFAVALVFIGWAALRGASQRRFILEALRSMAELARAMFRRG